MTNVKDNKIESVFFSITMMREDRNPYILVKNVRESYEKLYGDIEGSLSTYFKKSERFILRKLGPGLNEVALAVDSASERDVFPTVGCPPSEISDDEEEETEGEEAEVSKTKADSVKDERLFDECLMRTWSKIEDLRKKRKEIVQMEKEIALKRMSAGVKRRQNVDIVFLVDITGAMQRHMDKVKGKIMLIKDIVKKSFKGFKMRCAFIGYRDFDRKKDVAEDLEKRFEVLPLGPVEHLEGFLSKVKTSGGGDVAEDVFGGLEKIQELKFDETHLTRLLIHISDAPCHGREYHDLKGDFGDFYPSGDPKGRDINDLLGFLAELSIHYFFVQVEDTFTDKITTAKMIGKFKEIYERKGSSKGLKLIVFDNNEDYLTLFLRAVHKSISQSIDYEKYLGLKKMEEIDRGVEKEEKEEIERLKSPPPEPLIAPSPVDDLPEEEKCPVDPRSERKRLEAEEKEKKKMHDELINEYFRKAEEEKKEAESNQPSGEDDGDIPIEKNEGRRSWISDQRVERYTLANADEFSMDRVKSFKPRYDKEEIVLQIQNSPFARGTFRVVYKMKDSGNAQYVGKAFRKKRKREIKDRGMEYFRESLILDCSHQIAMKFNQELSSKGRKERIRFVSSSVIKYMGASRINCEYLTMEPFLKNIDRFTKYNNNGGNVFVDVLSNGSTFIDPAPQAFSHYTYERTKGYMMIVDLQGTKQEGKEEIWYEFTDPGIHSKKDYYCKEKKRKFGKDTNFGWEGYKIFFETHQCNEVCRLLGLKERKKPMGRSGVKRKKKK